MILFFLLFDFVSRSEANARVGDLPPTAIVFTGAYERIDKGLSLLSSGQVERVFISGANRTSGLIDTRFPGLFEANSKEAGWISDGRLVLAPDAHSTFENALETACWLENQEGVEAVTLITSRRHMARASVALQHRIAPTSVVRLISDPSENYNEFEIDLLEFGRFALTWFITLLPQTLWPADEPATCSDN